MRALAGKAVCRKCHPRCLRCSGFGFHDQVCQRCAGFKRGDQCVDDCPIEYYATTNTLPTGELERECMPCDILCRGCYGPHASQCQACRHFKIFEVSTARGLLDAPLRSIDYLYMTFRRVFETFAAQRQPSGQPYGVQLFRSDLPVIRPVQGLHEGRSRPLLFRGRRQGGFQTVSSRRSACHPTIDFLPSSSSFQWRFGANTVNTKRGRCFHVLGHGFTHDPRLALEETRAGQRNRGENDNGAHWHGRQRATQAFERQTQYGQTADRQGSRPENRF